MSTILVRHTGDEESSTEEVAQLNVLVDLEDFEGLFDQLEVWRGAASAGPFEELTSDRWRSAVLPKTAGDRPASPVTGPSVVIVGKTLEVMVNELHELAVTFTTRQGGFARILVARMFGGSGPAVLTHEAPKHLAPRARLNPYLLASQLSELEAA